MEVSDCEAAVAWIAANQSGRRSLTSSQRAALALELEKQLTAEAKKRLRLSNASKEKIPYSEKGQPVTPRVRKSGSVRDRGGELQLRFNLRFLLVLILSLSPTLPLRLRLYPPASGPGRPRRPREIGTPSPVAPT